MGTFPEPLLVPKPELGNQDKAAFRLLSFSARGLIPWLCWLIIRKFSQIILQRLSYRFLQDSVFLFL